MSAVTREKEVRGALSVGIGLGTILGTILGMILAATLRPTPPDAVCKADCEARGFHQGQFMTEHGYCRCWNRDFEKPVEEEEEESL